jgi:hypothetical protein
MMTNCSSHSAGCWHDNGLNGKPLTGAQQLQLEWTNYARWAPGPLQPYESFKAEWLTRHSCME